MPLRRTPLVLASLAIFASIGIAWWLSAVPQKGSGSAGQTTSAPEVARTKPADTVALDAPTPAERVFASSVGTPAPVDLGAAPAVARVTGRCRLRVEAPTFTWSGRMVLTNAGGHAWTAPLHADGSVVVVVPAPARYDVRVEALGLGPVWTFVDLEPGPRVLEFELEPETLYVELLDPLGLPFFDSMSPELRCVAEHLHPVASAASMTVGEAVDARAGIVSCRARGVSKPDVPARAWELEGQLGESGWIALVLDHRVLASAPYRVGETVMIVFDPARLPVTTSVVTCLVQDGIGGAPLAGAELEWRNWYGGVTKAVADEAGFARLAGVVSGPGQLWLRKPGWFARPRSLDVPATRTHDLGIVTLFPTRTLRGRVANAERVPCVVGYVRGDFGPGRFDWGPDDVRVAAVDSAGNFEFRDLAPSTYELIAFRHVEGVSIEPQDSGVIDVERVRRGGAPGWTHADLRDGDVDSIAVPFVEIETVAELFGWFSDRTAVPYPPDPRAAR